MTFFGLSEPVFRLGVFLAVGFGLALLEAAIPKRPPVAGKPRRWITNLGIIAIASVLVRAMGALAAPLVAVGAAVLAAEHGIGLLNQVELPPLLATLAAVLALDFALWLQHLASHKIPLLWRLHQVHHADRDVDFTTGIRFHPIEIGLSMPYKVLWVFALGASPLAVVLFEVILNGCSLFNHANIALPAPLERVLRAVIVTPDMHRVHHSIERREHDSNYGFNLSIWDRLFGTYTHEPAKGHLGMTVGLCPYQSEGPTRIGWSLLLPFRARLDA